MRHLGLLLRVGHVVLQLLDLVVQLADLAAARDRLVEHRAPAHVAHVLAEWPIAIRFGSDTSPSSGAPRR